MWTHEVSPEWLAARKPYLTASTIADLVKHKPNEVEVDGEPVDLWFARVWFSKQSMVPEQSPDTQPMIRGHVLEPYAVEQFISDTGHKMHHWDDVIIHNGVVGWSPDGLDVEQPKDIVSLESTDDCLKNATAAFEIKCYGNDKHSDCSLQDKMKLDERWQLVVAMWLMPWLTTAYLVFYNPNKENGYISIKEYTRDDFAKDFETVDKVVEKWTKTCATLDRFSASHHSGKGLLRTEREIQEEVGYFEQ